MLVAMPYYPEMCQQVLAVVKLLQVLHPQWLFILKAHPATPLASFESTAAILANNAQESKSAIHELLVNCMLMISGAQASTIIEAVACGVPTLLVGDDSSEIAIPDAIADTMYQICRDSDTADTMIAQLTTDNQRDSRKRIAAAQQFRNKCFTPVSTAAMTTMLAA